MIDLHMHTTASDGLSTPGVLIGQLQAAGITTFAITDHDTVAACGEMARRARDARLRFIPGIEITAVHDQTDVHLLGYFIDEEDPALRAFLAASRDDRLRRAREMGERLAALGVPIDIDRILAESGGPYSGKAIGRPAVARALVSAGHAATVQDAFDRYVAEGRPAYVGRIGASPAEVVGIIRDAGGVTSFAHPGLTGRDELIAPLAAAGLCAIECFHSEHDEATTAKYLALARAHDLAVTGGSDFHGVGPWHERGFGTVALPQEHFDAFVIRARR